MRSLGGGGGQGYAPAFPLVVTLPVILAASDLVAIPFRVPCDVLSISTPISGNLQALTAGTCAIDVTNDATAKFATLTWTAAGAATVSNQNVKTILPGDTMHFGSSGIGTTPVGCTIVIWLRVRG